MIGPCLRRLGPIRVWQDMPVTGFARKTVAVVAGSYVFRRFLFMLFVVWVASSLVFFLTRLTGQDGLERRFRVDEARMSRMTEAQQEGARKLEARFGFSRPLWQQYVSYLWRLARFDLGYSMTYYPITVNRIVADSVFWTLGLLSVTTVLAFVAGTVLGGLLGWPDSPGWFKVAFVPVMTLSAVPYYLLGLLLVFLLAFRLSLFPLSGGYTPGTLPERSLKFAWDVVNHSLLPALSIIVSSVGFWALSMRGMVVTVQGEDFMMQGRAKGLKRARLFLRYGIRNAMLPQATGLAISLGTILSGVVLVEIIFRYPGLGDALHRAIRRYDYSVISGLIYVIVLSLAFATFLIDVLYPRLDPRVRWRA